MSKKTFGFKVTEGQREIINDAVKVAMKTYSTDSKAVAAFSIFFNWLELAKAETIKGHDIEKMRAPDQLEAICKLGFLQKIIEPKQDVKLWHCLKQQRPNAKGKPILMGNGRDQDSILKLCKACEEGFTWHEQRSNLGKARAAIQRFGDMEIEAKINCCIHPANNAIQINLGTHGNFYCKIEDDRVTMTGTCGPNDCEHFFKTAAPLFVKDTEGYEQVKGLLE